MWLSAVGVPGRDRGHPGPREIDFVRSALAETMVTAYRQIRAARIRERLPDLRTAAYRFALDPVAAAYTAQGIFP